MTDTAAKPLIVALDKPDANSAMALVEQLSPALCRLKVGQQLFTAAGPQLVKALAAKGYDVFLDLKFHDIPNTVANAVAAAASLGVWMLNVHASGGEAMMRAAKAALADLEQPPLLIAVTVLTSLSSAELAATGVKRPLAKQVLALATAAQNCGLDGVVCSAQEAPMLKAKLGSHFKLVTPGIRPANRAADDQHRIVTPAQAIGNGSDYLVIGRPVTGAADPNSALKMINTELCLPVA